MENDLFYTTFVSLNISITFIIMIAACLCWKKKIPKNEFMGLEGMVKLKNPEDNNDIPIATVISNNDEHNNSLNSSIVSTADNGGDSKRASNNNAPHRSLPDIPVAVAINNDNISDLYATVNEKIHQKPQGRSPILSIKKEISLSQHSSISQADDVSSPYARVNQSTHNYDEVRNREHPYAQLNAPSSKNNTTTNIPILQIENLTDQHHNQQHQSLQISSRRSVVSANGVDNVQELIPAASAIAGMISASQELPYMTPPIVQQPHFSGDSQDSSKGYTSISVREPLVNILAQTKQQQNPAHPPRLSKHGIDSHYATVSDDSDEMYAAIEDPNNHCDIYTSGSETYAQIQPANNSIIVSVEINSSQGSRTIDNSDIEKHLERGNTNSTSNVVNNFSTQHQQSQPSLRAYDVHSRQPSDCSMGNLGSPKPEKRQANSPLPPTPKSNNISTLNLASTASISSGRNSVASIIEVRETYNTDIIIDSNSSYCTDDSSPKNKNNSSPSKDIEGMYAKVMKNSKFSNTSSQNNSPILSRKQFSNGSEETQILEFNRKDKKRIRSNSFNKNSEHKLIENRMSSDCGYSHVMKNIVTEEEYKLYSRQLFPQTSKEQCPISLEPGYESLPDTPPNLNDPGYETLLKPDNSNNIENKKTNSDYDPNYEVLQPLRPNYAGSTLGDDGYAKVIEKKIPNQFITQNTDNIYDDDDEDNIDGYSKVKIRTDTANVPGYSSILELSLVVPEINQQDNLQKNNKNHDYASISEALKPRTIINNNDTDIDQDYNTGDGDGNNIAIHCKNTNFNNNDVEKHADIYSTIVPKKDQSLNLSELKIIL